MKKMFRAVMVWAFVTGLLVGGGYGAGYVRGRGARTAPSNGLTPQQVLQLINGSGSGGGSQTLQLPAGLPAGPPP